MKKYWIYIITNEYNTVLYTGVTNNLQKRIEQHKANENPKSFTAKYNLTKLVYYDPYHNISEAVTREKQIKAGSRKKKLSLIESFNPLWEDLYFTLYGT